MLLLLLIVICIQFIASYIIGITAVCNMLVMYYVKSIARLFYMNTILYTDTDN